MFVLINEENSTSKCSNIDEKMEQPNAIDLRIDKVFEIKDTTIFELSEEQKTNRLNVEIIPDEQGYFNFQHHKSYQIEFNHEVHIGDNELGWIIPRSTLNRNGLFLTSGLYDSGFNNYIGAVLHNRSGFARIKKGTRVGQFLTAKAETRYRYDGQYQKD